MLQSPKSSRQAVRLVRKREKDQGGGKDLEKK